MRVTLVSYGSTGDAVPMVALALGLRRAGHEAIIVADESGRAVAAPHDLEFYALQGDLRAQTETGVHPLVGVVESGRFPLRTQYRLPDRAWLETIEGAAARSDLVIGLPLAGNHAMSAAQALGVRGIGAVLQPYAATREFVPPGVGHIRLPRFLNRAAGRLIVAAGWWMFGPGISRARAELGEPPIGDPTRNVRTLCAWSPTLLPKPSDWRDNIRVTGDWPLPSAGPVLSDKDRSLPSLAEFDSPFPYDGEPLAATLD